MKSKVWIILAILIAAGSGTYFYQSRKNPPQAQYRSVSAEPGPIRITVLSTGVVQPENRVDIKPPIAGRAERVLVQEGDKVRKGQPLVWMSSSERATLLDAARARGPEELAKWEDLYRPTPILAPISGTIILRSIEAGQTFATTDAILAMSDRLTIEAQVDETDIASIRNQQPATITLDVYPNQPIPGKVEHIAYEAKTVNNVTTYSVTVVPDQVPEHMRSGMTANVTFEVAAKQDALLIPSEALKSKGDAFYVLVPAPTTDAPPVERLVKTGLSDGKQTEIVEGLQAGETALVANPTAQDGSSKSGNPFMPQMPRRQRR